jgi:hypothetical protein
MSLGVSTSTRSRREPTGDVFDPAAIGAAEWSDVAYDMRLQPRAFERLRGQLANLVPKRAAKLIEVAHAEGWHSPSLDDIAGLIATRAAQL